MSSFWSDLFGGGASKRKQAREARKAETIRQEKIQGQLDQVRAEYGETDPELTKRYNDTKGWIDNPDSIPVHVIEQDLLNHGYGNLQASVYAVQPEARQVYVNTTLKPQLAAMEPQIGGRAANKTRRDKVLADYGKEYERHYGVDLRKQFTDANRGDLFLGADTGTVGGAADRVRQKRRLAEFLGGRQTIAANAARSVDDLRNQDQDQRLALEDLIRSGNADQLAVDRSLGELKSNADSARSAIGAQQLGDFFSSAGSLYDVNRRATDAQTSRRLFSDRSLSGGGGGRTSSGTISRA